VTGNAVAFDASKTGKVVVKMQMHRQHINATQMAHKGPRPQAKKMCTTKTGADGRPSSHSATSKLNSGTGETQTQVGVGVRGDCLRELLDSRRTKRCALQWRSQSCLQARVWNSSSPSNLVFVTASCSGSENGIFYHFLNQWHRFNREVGSK
jgi:hypothetical protein